MHWASNDIKQRRTYMYVCMLYMWHGAVQAQYCWVVTKHICTHTWLLHTYMMRMQTFSTATSQCICCCSCSYFVCMHVCLPLYYVGTKHLSTRHLILQHYRLAFCMFVCTYTYVRMFVMLFCACALHNTSAHAPTPHSQSWVSQHSHAADSM